VWRAQPSTAAINATLLAFAAVRRCCCSAVAAGRAAIDRYPARWAYGSKPAARCCSG